MRPSTPVRRCQPRQITGQTGTSLIEFSVVAVPLLLIGLGGAEIAHWFFVKQAVSLALLQAARAGITHHADPHSIEAAFEEALLPLYPSASVHASKRRMQRAWAQRSAINAIPPWQIRVMGPSRQAFQDFHDTSLAIGQKTALAAINNNYQAEQDQRNRTRGWAHGVGPISGLTIYQANTLVLHATYLHEPLLPGIKGLIRMLSTKTPSYAQQAMAGGGYLPIQQELQLTMQSHPVDWPALANRKVIKRHASLAIATTVLPEPCHGIWCLQPTAIPAYVSPGSTPPHVEIPPGSDPGAVDTGAAAPIDAGGGEHAGEIPGNTGTAGDFPFGADPNSSPAPDDPACGITLCCVIA